MPRYSTKLKPKAQPKQSLLPIWLTLAGLAMVIFAGWALVGNKPQPKAGIQVTGAPRLQIDQDKIDHGQVKLGTPITDTVRVTNIGDQPLSFSEAPYIEVKEGC